jgi:hypothetical protein
VSSRFLSELTEPPLPASVMIWTAVMCNLVDRAHLFSDINLLEVFQQMDAIPMQEGATR